QLSGADPAERVRRLAPSRSGRPAGLQQGRFAAGGSAGKHVEVAWDSGEVGQASRPVRPLDRPGGLSHRYGQISEPVILSTGIYYAVALTAAGVLVGWLAGPWFSLPLYLAAAFCLWFFRDPEREIPSGPIAVSPADGRVMAVKRETLERQRVSIFLNVFDV